MEDDRLLAIRLDNIIILGKKIHTNFSRFQMGVVAGTNVGGHGLYCGHEGFRNRAEYAKRMDYRSYADVIAITRAMAGSSTMERACLRYNLKEDIIKRLYKAFVGSVVVSSSTFTIQTQFEMEGLFKVKITLMGKSMSARRFGGGFYRGFDR